MVRKTALVTAMLGAFASQAFAMGLGDIQLHSALNQPLDAEIELLSPTAADLNDLRAALASSEAYAKAGVERAFFHTRLRFEVVKRSDGSAAIKVTSREPVREPYLDFLLEATWGSGQALREYTVLVDPPVLMPAPAPRITAPEPAAPASAYTGRVAGGAVDGEYRVGNGDTTWRVATSVRPDSSVSVEQVMLSLLRANPHAFINQNINSLKAGQVLRVPSREDMAAINHADALAEVRDQWNQWQGRRAAPVAASETVAPAAATETPAAPATDAAAVQPSETDAQLKLVAPQAEDTEAAKATTAAGQGGGKSVEEMRKELTLAVEAVEAQRLENQDLNSRLKQLEQQITQLHSLIELKNTEMAQLSGAAPATAGGAVAPTPTEPVAGTAPAGQATPEQAAPTEPAADAQADTGTPAEVVAPETKVATTAPVPEASVTEPVPQQAKGMPEAPAEAGGLLATLLANPLVKWGGAGGAVIIGLLTWMASKRRRMEDANYQESILADRHPGGAKVMSSAAIVAERSSLAATAHDRQVEPRSKEATQTDSSLFTDFAVSDMGAVQSDAEADPVAEADVYLAYGRYQQAEELIRNALNRAPQRNELRYKLLEVLFAAKNTNAFDTEAEALLATLGSQEDEMWIRVVEMGQELNPGNPLYRAGGVEAVTAVAEQGLDFDLGELASFVPQTQEAAPSLPVDEELSFDLSAGSDFEDAGEGLLASADEVATKLDLARAYLEMGDPDGARSILQEVLDEGNVAQKSEAQALLSQMG